MSKPQTASAQRIMDAADKAKTELEAKLVALAEKRLVEWRFMLHARFPRLHGHILFGMGSESITVGKKRCQVDYERKGLLLRSAMEDVWEICDGYKLACPDDFEF